jgi:hypothetical protein
MERQSLVVQRQAPQNNQRSPHTRNHRNPKSQQSHRKEKHFRKTLFWGEKQGFFEMIYLVEI